MNSSVLNRRTPWMIAVALVASGAMWMSGITIAADEKPAEKLPPHPLQSADGFDATDGELEKLPLEFPNPAFAGTPKDKPAGAHVLKSTGKPRPDFMAPKGLKNVAEKKTVTSSDKNPIIGDLSLVTDGDKEALDGRWVELAPGKQWIQIDLGEEQNIFVVMLWHHHIEARIYKDVVVQVSNDPEMKKDVKTIYNNDYDNTLGFGAGDGWEYFENYEGFLIPIKHGVKGRYLRCWSNGNTSDDQNHYTEVEAWAKPAK